MGHKPKNHLSRAEKERLRKKHFHVSLVMAVVFAVLGLITTGAVAAFFFKGSELTTAAMVYWHLFGSLEG